MEEIGKGSRHERLQAGSSATPPQVLGRLAGHKDPEIRALVGDNQSTSQEVLASLAQDRDSTVRARVARNPSTDPVVLRELAEHASRVRDSAILHRVAANPTTSAELLAELADHEDPMVRQCVASNLAAPDPVLQKLTDERVPEVVAAAASNPSLSSPRLALLANHAADVVRAGVAANPSANGLLQDLSEDVSAEVRLAVASNWTVSDLVLERLVIDPDPTVANTACQRLYAAVRREEPFEYLDNPAGIRLANIHGRGGLRDGDDPRIADPEEAVFRFLQRLRSRGATLADALTISTLLDYLADPDDGFDVDWPPEARARLRDACLAIVEGEEWEKRIRQHLNYPNDTVRYFAQAAALALGVEIPQDATVPYPYVVDSYGFQVHQTQLPRVHRGDHG